MYWTMNAKELKNLLKKYGLGCHLVGWMERSQLRTNVCLDNTQRVSGGIYRCAEFG